MKAARSLKDLMSQHFDTRVAKNDPRLNLCDLYLFAGRPHTAVMAMTVNPDVGLSTPDVLHPEALYAFRFDLNGDSREELAFKFRFGAPRHAAAGDEQHRQDFKVLRATAEQFRVTAETFCLKARRGVCRRDRAFVLTSVPFRNSSRETRPLSTIF